MKASWDFADGAPIANGCRAIKALGGGESSEVWLAWDELLRRMVVCKLLRPDFIADAGALRELKRESELLSRLSHPGLVRCLRQALGGERPHLVLEHVHAPNLRRLMRKSGPLGLEKAGALARAMCDALAYLAAQGIAHLDVKPSNIVMGSPPRLIDFSLARSVDAALRIRRPVGTTRYMAPEQCAPLERGPVTLAADVWALGVTLYEAVSGRLPFRKGEQKGSPPEARYPQLSEGPALLDSALPAAVREAVMACLAQDPRARPAPARLAAAFP